MTPKRQQLLLPRGHTLLRAGACLEPKSGERKREASSLSLGLQDKRKNESLFALIFSLFGSNAIRPRRGCQDTQKQIPKKTKHYAALFFFVLDRLGCCCSCCCEQASELSVGFDVVGVDVVGVVLGFWPMLSLASSSSPAFSPLFAASTNSAVWERTSSLLLAASDSNDRIVVVLVEPAEARAAAEAQCKFVVVDRDGDATTFVVCGLCHSVCVVFSFNFWSSSSRYDKDNCGNPAVKRRRRRARRSSNDLFSSRQRARADNDDDGDEEKTQPPLLFYLFPPAQKTGDLAVAPTATTTAVLDVGGMSCGGCSAAVTRILSKNTLEGASVTLLTSTAVVRFRGALSPSEASAAAEAAATLLTKKGFPSTARRDAEGDVNAAAEASDVARRRELRRASLDLAVAWGLALVCCAHHAGHWLHAAGIHSMAHGPVAEALSKPLVAGLLGAAALAGPGRPVLADGAAALFKRGAPNMNSLVALGSVASFTAGTLGPTLFPSLGFGASFMEEPVMLLAFVLLGRAAEARARLEASADLRALAGLVPSDARLVLDPGVAPSGGGGPSIAPLTEETALVRTAAVAVGDVVRVLPGERVPVDGVVISSSSSSSSASADEALLTGESSLVPKREGDAVAAGAVVYGSPLDIRATATGGDCAVARMAALVKDAQAREAPSQRLADAVSGRFCYGVMGIAAATALFWGSGLGLSLVPGAAAAAGRGAGQRPVGRPI